MNRFSVSLIMLIALAAPNVANAQVHALESQSRTTVSEEEMERRALPDLNQPRTDRRVRLQLQAFDAEDEITIFRGDGDTREEICTTPCTRSLSPGRYTLSAGDGDSHLLTADAIDINRSGRIRIDYRPQHAKRRGMGVATVLFGSVGTAALVYALRAEQGSQKMMATGGVLLGIAFATLLSALFSRDRIDVTYLPE